MDKNNLLHAVLNQIETDLDDQDYDALDELLQLLIDIPEAKEKLIAYLSDSALENLNENLTHQRY
jgi:hypothetical protein